VLKIKICGLTNVDDALAAAEEGADYAGLIFARSPRQVDLGTAREIVKRLPRGVEAVGVFRDQSEDEVRHLMDATGVGVAQLHGRETPELARALGAPVIKTFDTFSEASLERLKAYDAFAFLLDVPKGEGARARARIDPEWALLAKRHGRVILAGRLDAANVGEMVRRVRPFGVDTCRGTEKSPGVKDRAKIRDFIQAARAAQRETTKIKVRTR
jgi:phosphoribosylanthranilate isomerase